MAKIAMIAEGDVEPATVYGHATQVRGLEASRILSPPDYSLRLVAAELSDGAEMTWTVPHGDEAVYVRTGALRVEGADAAVAVEGGAVLVESGATCTLTATDRTGVLHYAPVSADPPTDGPLGPADPEGHGVHVVGPDGWAVTRDADRTRVTWFGDGTCPTCRMQCFHVRRFPVVDEERGVAHHHSEDEIIFVLEGTIRAGAHRLRAGTAVSIPAGVRYALTTRGHAFLNFRRNVSLVTVRPDGDARVETTQLYAGDFVQR